MFSFSRKYVFASTNPRVYADPPPMTAFARFVLTSGLLIPVSAALRPLLACPRTMTGDVFRLTQTARPYGSAKVAGYPQQILLPYSVVETLALA